MNAEVKLPNDVATVRSICFVSSAPAGVRHLIELSDVHAEASHVVPPRTTFPVYAVFPKLTPITVTDIDAEVGPFATAFDETFGESYVNEGFEHSPFTVVNLTVRLGPTPGGVKQAADESEVQVVERQLLTPTPAVEEKSADPKFCPKRVIPMLPVAGEFVTRNDDKRQPSYVNAFVIDPVFVAISVRTVAGGNWFQAAILYLMEVSDTQIVASGSTPSISTLTE